MSGQLRDRIQEGSVAITQGSCIPKTYGPGDTIVEVPHLPVRAVAIGHFAWTTTFIVFACAGVGAHLVRHPSKLYAARLVRL
jgi:hypothetical protein